VQVVSSIRLNLEREKYSTHWSLRRSLLLLLLLSKMMLHITILLLLTLYFSLPSCLCWRWLSWPMTSSISHLFFFHHVGNLRRLSKIVKISSYPVRQGEFLMIYPYLRLRTQKSRHCTHPKSHRVDLQARRRYPRSYNYQDVRVISQRWTGGEYASSSSSGRLAKWSWSENAILKGRRQLCVVVMKT